MTYITNKSNDLQADRFNIQFHSDFVLLIFDNYPVLWNLLTTLFFVKIDGTEQSFTDFFFTKSYKVKKKQLFHEENRTKNENGRNLLPSKYF